MAFNGFVAMYSLAENVEMITRMISCLEGRTVLLNRHHASGTRLDVLPGLDCQRAFDGRQVVCGAAPVGVSEMLLGPG